MLGNEKYVGDLLLQKTLIEDFLTHRLVKNKGQLPQYYVENAHSPIIPRSVFERAREELWLRGSHGKKGGMRFGSRTALIGRTFCRCGSAMRRLRRGEPVFICDTCGQVAPEADIKAQVLEALRALPDREGEIRALIEYNRPALEDGERLERARALRREWYLLRLLPTAGPRAYKAECADEADFLSRTGRRVKTWDDDAIVRLLDRVTPGECVVFKGGVHWNVDCDRMGMKKNL